MTADGADDDTWCIQLLNGEEECCRVIWREESIYPGSGGSVVFVNFA